MTCHHITKRTERIAVFVVAALLFVLAVSIGGASCAGAPKDLAELDAMPEADFQDWKQRMAAVAEEAAYSVVRDKPERLETVERLSDSMRTLCKGVVTADTVKLLTVDEAYAGLLRIATMELSAAIRQRVGPLPHPRLAELVCAFADALEVGAIRALEEMPR